MKGNLLIFLSRPQEVIPTYKSKCIVYIYICIHIRTHEVQNFWMSTVSQKIHHFQVTLQRSTAVDLGATPTQKKQNSQLVPKKWWVFVNPKNDGFFENEFFFLISLLGLGQFWFGDRFCWSVSSLVWKMFFVEIWHHKCVLVRLLQNL